MSLDIHAEVLAARSIEAASSGTPLERLWQFAYWLGHWWPENSTRADRAILAQAMVGNPVLLEPGNEDLLALARRHALVFPAPQGVTA